ncbi:sulfatase/phosphatase domain-containing protein, partial [Martelella limonii]|uniref:sulfatase/phosphatase domain-containing protein n=1 Tax=Martelella limonii TaxID=1647649 RepID=UPI00157FC02B
RENNAPPEWELYDCDKDPMELFNVANDPAYAGIFKAMLEKLDAKQADIGDVPEHDSKEVLKGLVIAS